MQRDCLGKSKRNFRVSVFKSLFDFWVQHKVINKEEEFVWKITKDYFEDAEKWESYFSNSVNRLYSSKEDSSIEEGLQLSKTFIELFKQEFEQFYDAHLSKTINLTIRDTKTFEEGDEIPGFYTFKDFKSKYPNMCPDNLDDDQSFYIPKKKIDSDDFAEMVLRFSPFIPQFLINPNIKLKDYNKNEINSVVKVKIRISRKINIEGDTTIKGSYEYTCPGCGAKIIKKPYEMAEPKPKHYYCPAKPTSKGLGNTTIAKGSYLSGAILAIHCYELYCFTKDDVMEKEKSYFFSFNKNITPGIYYADIVNVNGGLVKPEDKETRTMILGMKRASPKILEGAISRQRGEKLAESFGCLPHKIFDIWESAINYYKINKNINISPHKGSWLQYCLVFSFLARTLFKNRNFPIVVIGDTSISKTYPAKLFTQLFDIDARLTSGPSSQTYAGIYGGVNTDVMIGSKKYKAFQEGSAGAGMVVLDEGQHWFDQSKEFNENLKSLPNDEIDNMKIGAERVPQRFTPIIFFNFTNYHTGIVGFNGRDSSYEGEIKFYYWKLIRGVESIEEFHQPTKTEADKYVNSKNLYLPLQNFDNEFLREAIALVRNMRFKKDTCWWSGGSEPAQNRFLFDCVVRRSKVVDSNPFSKNTPQQEALNVYDIATVDFIETVKSYCASKTDSNKKINLGKQDRNSISTKEQMKKLRMSVIEYLKKDQDILTHYKNGKNLDEKLAGNIISFFVHLQLIDDVDSEEIKENTILAGRICLLKNKRGLKEEEYNFVDNSYIPDPSIINDEKYSSDELLNKVEKLNQFDEDEKIQERIKEELEKQKKSSIDVEQENKNSMNIMLQEENSTSKEDEREENYG